MLHCRDDLRLGGFQILSVQAKEYVGSHESRPLVSVDESMILGETKCVGGRRRREIHPPGVRKPVLRSRQGRFQRAFVPDPGRSTVLTQLSVPPERRGPFGFYYPVRSCRIWNSLFAQAWDAHAFSPGV